MLSSLSSLSSLFLSFPFLSLVFLSILSPSYTKRGRDNDRERVRVTSPLPSLVACLVPRLVRLYCTLFLIESVFSVCISAYLRFFDPVRVYTRQ
ncbi:hypothetical protein J3E68DRAFT_290670 [Trichoderma sp. SZMC 28012]